MKARWLHLRRLGLSWLVASLVVGVLRLGQVVFLGVWTPEGQLAVSPTTYSVILTVQIALTGGLAFLLAALLEERT